MTLWTNSQYVIRLQNGLGIHPVNIIQLTDETIN